jgi:hypothetical protein
MILETIKYKNNSELLTVVKLKKEDGTILDELKLYNAEKEVEIDRDLRFTAEHIDEFILKIYQYSKSNNLEFNSQVINIED